jgi:hypothetical protein
VRHLVHDHTGQLDRILIAAQPRYCSCRECSAIHDAGIELDVSEEIREPAEADTVIVRIRLDAADGGDDRIEGRAAGGKNLDSVAHADAGIGAAHEKSGHCPPQPPRDLAIAR